MFAQFTFNLFLGFSYEQDFSSEPEAYSTEPNWTFSDNMITVCYAVLQGNV